MASATRPRLPRRVTITDPNVIAEVAALAPRVAAGLTAAAFEGQPGAAEAAEAWTRLAAQFCPPTQDWLG